MVSPRSPYRPRPHRPLTTGKVPIHGASPQPCTSHVEAATYPSVRYRRPPLPPNSLAPPLRADEGQLRCAVSLTSMDAASHAPREDRSQQSARLPHTMPDIAITHSATVDVAVTERIRLGIGWGTGRSSRSRFAKHTQQESQAHEPHSSQVGGVHQAQGRTN